MVTRVKRPPKAAPAGKNVYVHVGEPKSAVVVIVSDKHGGSKFALLNPETQLTNADTGESEPVALNPVQENLWKWHLEDLAQVKALAGNRPVALLDLGDATQGNKFGKEMVASNMAHQVEIAYANLEPWLQLPGLACYRQVAGTGVHEFGEAAASILIYRHLKERYPKLDNRVVYHALSTLYGVTFDLSHHGPTGGIREWLYGNELRLYVRNIMRLDLRRNQKPPDVVARGHVHVYCSEVVTEQEHETRGLIIPSWQYPYEFVRKVGKSPAYVTFGLVALEIERGQILGRPHAFKRTIDHRTKEIVE